MKVKDFNCYWINSEVFKTLIDLFDYKTKIDNNIETIIDDLFREFDKKNIHI